MAGIIPFDDRDGSLWYDGRLVPWRDAKTHVLTHGLHYGSCVFEGERIYAGHIFRHDEHVKRLFESARILGMKIPYTEDEIARACYAAAAVQGITDGYVRPVVFRGSEMMAVAAQQTKIHVAVAVWQWPSYFDPKEKLKGIRLDFAQWRRPAPDTAPTKAKAAGLYMICTLSKHAAEAKGYADALMLDYRGLVAEATGANVFFVKDGQLHTPTPDCFLDGITRRTVIALARTRHIPVHERAINPEELAGFEECFITGTAAEVTPVSEIGPYRFTPGIICETLMNDYTAEVNRPVPADAARERINASA
ncbi:MAG TPA: branched-chain amino acid aminotransferase [Micropepsaceae bacterium]